MANTFNHISATKTTTLIKKYIVKNYKKNTATHCKEDK